MLNEELIPVGLATAQVHDPFSEQVKRRFELAEAESKAAGRGIWSL